MRICRCANEKVTQSKITKNKCTDVRIGSYANHKSEIVNLKSKIKCH